MRWLADVSLCAPPLKTFQQLIIVNYAGDSSTRDSEFSRNLTSRKMRLRSVLLSLNELLDSTHSFSSEDRARSSAAGCAFN